MRFASLGSGSRGNATVVSHRKTCVLVDCGFSMRETEQRLQRLHVDPQHLTAIVVTHEHQDHRQGVGAMARKYSLPVFMTRGTQAANAWGELETWTAIEPETIFSIGDIELTPFTVPHDAAEPVQFVFSDGDKRLGLLTDTGMITAHIIEQLTGLDALLLECNHDAAMLQDSDYPPTLKQRVGGDYGHLNNAQAADLLCKIKRSDLQHVAAMHLSQQNNQPQLAQRALAQSMGCAFAEILVADQLLGLDWLSI